MPREGLKTVSFDEKRHEKLKKISEALNKPMRKIVEDFIDDLPMEVPVVG